MTVLSAVLYTLIGAITAWQSTHKWDAAVLGGLVALKAWHSQDSAKGTIANAAAGAEQTVKQLAAEAVGKMVE